MTRDESHAALFTELSQKIHGAVNFDAGTRALYASDASNYRHVPIGHVRPLDEQDLIKAVEICRKHDAPILMRGAGTSLAGQTVNHAVVLDISGLNKILEINAERKFAWVEPGVVLDNLRKAAKAHGLTFGPDPATHNRCTFGGMIANNSCGVHSIMAGKTVENVEELEILTYDGIRMRVGKTSPEKFRTLIQEGGRKAEIANGLKKIAENYAELIRKNYPQLPRRVSGYNLDELLPEKDFHIARSLVGTEGTCAIILKAKVKLIPDPPARSLLVLGYPDIYQAADQVPLILSFKPIGIEGLDENFILNMKKAGLHASELALFPEGRGWLIVEFGNETAAEAEASAKLLVQKLEQQKSLVDSRLLIDPPEQKKVWSVRESSFGATVFVPGVKDTFSGFEDSAVRPEKLGLYLRDLEKLYQKYDYYAVTYGHFGDGCIHCRISFDLRTDPGIQTYRRFLEEASDLVLRYGGSFSGEHGDGQTWGEFLPKMYGPELVKAFHEFKLLWDPQNKMNPGRIVNPVPATENLRLKNYASIPSPDYQFSFIEEKGNFTRTTERCIGIGKCLKKDEGTMCPSYMVTSEEKHSTRGRARLLHEMMRGEVLDKGFQEESVKEALDLCLACKACKKECPVSVDMATYKAEFLSHYYEKKARPLSAYAFGFISKAAQLASFFPGPANFLANLTKGFIGVSSKRKLPAFARQPFKKWFFNRKKAGTYSKKVLLWPDTFNNHFYPEIAKAATEVLEKLGYEVVIPKTHLCCGRPFYDYGLLKEAKAALKKIASALKQEGLDRLPMIVLEPSCWAVFRDELKNLFPQEEWAKQMASRIFLLGEFLVNEDQMKNFPQKNLEVLLHGHCHQKALASMENETKIFQAMGVSARIPDTGCCGMAGAFGFEKNHYEVSMKLAERVLLPEVRNADSKTLILTDGFSCREQMVQGLGKRPLHLAEFLRDCLKRG